MIKTGLTASIFIILLMIGMSYYGWTVIPEETLIARHWDINGEPDRYSPRNHVLIGLPLMAVLLTILFIIVPSIDPRRDNIEKSSGLLLTTWIGGLSLLALVHTAILMNAITGKMISLPVMMTGVGVLLVMLGNFMAKSRSSWFIGLRTPWTLTSEHAWVTANRTAGWMFVMTGLVTVILVWIVDVKAGIWAMILGATVTALLGVVVSYFAWRADPDRAQ